MSRLGLVAVAQLCKLDLRLVVPVLLTLLSLWFYGFVFLAVSAAAALRVCACLFVCLAVSPCRVLVVWLSADWRFCHRVKVTRGMRLLQVLQWRTLPIIPFFAS